MTQAIKGFNKDWTCRDLQFAPGGTYETPGTVKACENRFHAIEGHPLEVFGYYPPGTSRYAEVTLSGDMAREDSGDSKIAAQRIKINAEISLGDLISRAVEYVASRAKMAEGATANADGAAAQASSIQGAAQASGWQGAAQASGWQGAAQASGDYGAAQASGYQGAAQASGDYGAAQALGDYGAAQASGYQGAAQASGTQGAAQASGDRGAAQASGYQGAAQASGTQGAAQASGYQGAAQASGDYGAAQALGDYGAAQALGEASTALASGHEGKVSGKTGCALFLVYREPSTGAILHAWAGIVGRDGIEPDVFYTLNPDGQPVPTT
jgi:hypothetical protein